MLKIDFIAAAAAAAELGDALLVLNYVLVLYRDARLRELAQREASVDPTLLDLVPVRVDVAPCDGRNGFSSLQSQEGGYQQTPYPASKATDR